MVIKSLSKIQKIKAGGFHNLAISKDGDCWFWGRNDSNQCLVDIEFDGVSVPTVAWTDNSQLIKNTFLGWDVTEILTTGDCSLEMEKGFVGNVTKRTVNAFKKMFGSKSNNAADEKEDVKFLPSLHIVRIFAHLHLTRTRSRGPSKIPLLS